MHPEEKLREMGLTLPRYYQPAASYRHYRQVNEYLYIAGQNPREDDGTLHRGTLGLDMSVEEGYKDARLTGLNILAVAKEALGDLGRVQAVVKVFGMVHATADFTRHPEVINGCSDLFLEVFGQEIGGHPRSAVGFVSLPMGISVEIEAIMLVR